MKPKFTILFFLFLSAIGYSQESVYVKGKNYKGYIFSKDYSMFGIIGQENGRYTPTLSDIHNIESILRDSIDYIRVNQTMMEKDGTLIYKNLKKYKRQYMGYINQKGERVIWINFFKDYKGPHEISNDIIVMLDGGSNYWSICVNLDKRKLFDMQVNGTS